LVLGFHRLISAVATAQISCAGAVPERIPLVIFLPPEEQVSVRFCLRGFVMRPNSRARGRGSSVPACFVHLPPAPISLCPPVDFAKDSFPHSLIFRAACSGLIRLPLGAFLIFSAWPNPSP
jgi:hypothetical protein